jgi:SET domain-containing protein 6
LRRYGHVDLLPLPQGGEGNPGDVVEIRADLVVTALSQRDSNFSSDSCEVRIDWWLENGGDE